MIAAVPPGHPKQTLLFFHGIAPWNLAREVDIQHLLEVETLVTRLCDFSHRAGLEIEFELDGKFVGAIRNGAMDVTLSVGLLGEWRRHLSP